MNELQRLVQLVEQWQRGCSYAMNSAEEMQQYQEFIAAFHAFDLSALRASHRKMAEHLRSQYQGRLDILREVADYLDPQEPT